jgi:hypothetical protein
LNAPFTARDIEEAIAPGIDSLRAVFSGQATEEDRQQAEFFLKADARATAKRGAENNSLRTLLMLAKHSGASPVDLKPVFSALVGRFAAIEGPSGGSLEGGKEA